MRFGLLYANVGPYAQAGNAVRLAQAAEVAGFESLWAVEHVAVPAGYRTTYPYSDSGRMPMAEDADLPDPLTWLSFLAGVTSTIRLCTGVVVLPLRHPVVLAKQVATLDALSGGRVTLGVGAGWMRDEFEALGLAFEGRGRRLEESVAVMRSLWSGQPAAHQGETYAFHDLICRPRPAQPSVPIVIGGHSDLAARRAGRIAQGFFPAKGDLSRLFRSVRESAEEAGRDPDSVELTTGIAPSRAWDCERIERLGDRGVSRVLVPVPDVPAADIGGELARYAERVIANFA